MSRIHTNFSFTMIKIHVMMLQKKAIEEQKIEKAKEKQEFVDLLFQVNFHVMTFYLCVWHKIPYLHHSFYLIFFFGNVIFTTTIYSNHRE